MYGLLLDVGQALRLFRRQRGFAFCAVLTVAIGVGAATLVFSLVHAALLRALPFDNPETLVWMYNARTERERAPFSLLDLNDYRQGNSTLVDLAVFTNWTANLTGAGPPERLEGTRVSGNFFPLLGVKPLLGRTFNPGDEDGDARVAVITHGLWVRRFAADPQIAGHGVLLNGATYTVVGVLPRGFMFPFREAEVAVPTTLGSDPRRSDRGANFLRVVARLRPGVSLTQAKADLDAIAHRLQRLYPDEDTRKTGVNLYPLHTEIVRDYRQILWTLFAAVGLFLLVGCGNLANLLFVRATDRSAEFALRTSLGASRARIIRQLSMEALVITAAGGMIGAIVAGIGASAWRLFGPDNFPRRDAVALDGSVLTFALATAFLVALMCSFVTARAATRDPGSLSGATGRATGTRRQRAIRRAFVATQIAGAAVLLVCMGLVARGFADLQRVSAGFTPDHALSIQLSLPPLVYKDRASLERFGDALRLRFMSIPGVRSAGAVSLRPLAGLLSTMDVAFPGRPAPSPEEVPQAHFRVATAGYFGAAGIPMLAGREFRDDDLARSRSVAIVSRTFAARHWPGESALGKSVQIAPGRLSAPMEVVGVASDVKQFGLDGSATADLYVPLPQMPPSQAALLASRMYWVLRTTADPRLFAVRVRDAVRSVDPDVATSSVQTLDDIVASSLASWRVNVRLLELFGQFGVLLCAFGVYAVASYSSSARRRELGIRAAFGATRGALILMMLRDELKAVMVGLLAGLSAALAAAPHLGPLLFRTSPYEPSTYLMAAAGLFAVAVVATYMPVRRAGRSNPSDLLRV